MVYAIGDTLEFTTPEGQILTGVIQGRNWCFDVLTSYIVDVGALSYNVNAVTFASGHSF